MAPSESIDITDSPTSCIICTKDCDSEYVQCIFCLDYAHGVCLCINTNFQLKCGKVMWSCEKCKSLTDILSQLTTMRSQLSALVNLPNMVNELKTEVQELKSSRKPRETMSYASATNSSASTLPNDPPPNAVPTRLTERRPRSNSTKRTHAEPFRKKTTLVTGSANTTGSFKGVYKPPARRHFKVCRFSSENTEETLKQFCQERGVVIFHVREITRSGASF